MIERRYLAEDHYDRLCDQNIVKLAQTGDIRASEYLLYRYRGLVRTKTRSYFLIGGDRDDLLQIGMIGLWQSVMDYSPEKKISFLSFARLCIERHVIAAIKTTTRHKQSPLNNAVSLEYNIEEPESDLNFAEIMVSDIELDPQELLLRKEETKRMHRELKALLSEFEWEVLRRYYLGMTYREIAIDLECSAKSVDNALGRIKRKVSDAPSILVG